MIVRHSRVEMVPHNNRMSYNDTFSKDNIWLIPHRIDSHISGESSNLRRGMILQYISMRSMCKYTDTRERCSICLDSHPPQHSWCVTCRTSFHSNCVYRWLEMKDARCPICRQPPSHIYRKKTKEFSTTRGARRKSF